MSVPRSSRIRSRFSTPVDLPNASRWEYGLSSLRLFGHRMPRVRRDGFLHDESTFHKCEFEMVWPSNDEHICQRECCDKRERRKHIVESLRKRKSSMEVKCTWWSPFTLCISWQCFSTRRNTLFAWAIVSISASSSSAFSPPLPPWTPAPPPPPKRRSWEDIRMLLSVIALMTGWRNKGWRGGRGEFSLWSSSIQSHFLKREGRRETPCCCPLRELLRCCVCHPYVSFTIAINAQ